MPYHTKFRVPPTGVLAALDETSKQGSRIELSSVIFAGDNEWFEFLTVVGDSGISPSTLGTRDRIIRVQRSNADHHHRTNHFLLHVREPPQFIVTKLTENGAIPHRIFLRDGYVTVITSVDDWNHVRNLADAIEEAYATFELLGTSQVDGVGHPLGSERLPFDVHAALSTEQLRVLETAHEMGMFEVPQEATGKEVADRLKLSQSAVSEKLRRAQQNICELFFGRRQTDTSRREADHL